MFVTALWQYGMEIEIVVFIYLSHTMKGDSDSLLLRQCLQ